MDCLGHLSKATGHLQNAHNYLNPIDPSDIHLYNMAKEGEIRHADNRLLKAHQNGDDEIWDTLINPRTGQLYTEAEKQAIINSTENSSSSTIATNLQNHLDSLEDNIKNDYDVIEIANRMDVDQFSNFPISENNPLDKLGGTNADTINWLPQHIQEIVKLKPELQQQLEFLSIAATMPLEDFQNEFWPNASTYPQFDWSNNGCSVPGWLGGPDRIANGMEVPCIRHDFVYRNFERIDAQFGFNGVLLDHHDAIENIADDQLGRDADSISGKRSRIVEIGVELPGSGADSDWEEPVDWNDPNREFYGDGYTPEDFNN